ncbi:response regulator [Flavobacterium sp. Fl-77]|uniref:histidine kinase n=1 Tax=Flavobacterium flavipigmentatum TaxID=2893884 RepID=A0AAJ2SFG1_9FLAO|nr:MULTISPECIES: response regulator [unclassified Flavobacterium]MDX6182680.1 response regulator [Flavobacterium sp. Fl-33]MDX6186140.1 response regulator [Flavobacterium sp. Fl-77]UFH38288.1 response regulator [Flavobacterium sp. F-70]
MPPIRIVLFFLLFMSCCDNFVLAQTDANVLRILKKAENEFKEANFEQSLITSRVALNTSTYIKNDYLIARSYKVIAANYNELVEFDKAIFFYKKALIYASKTDNDTIKNKIYNNLGNMYCFEKKSYSEGIDYYKKSIRYCLKIKDSSQVYFTTVNITWAFFDIASFSQGKRYLDFLNKNHIKFGDDSTEVILNMLNGMYCRHTKEIEKANAYFLKAIQLGKKSTEKSDLSFAHLEYSKFLSDIKKYKEAYYNLQKYNAITDELYNVEKLKKASIAGFNLELDEYKRQIDKIESEKDSQYQSLRKSRIIVFLFVLISFVFLILIFTLFKNISFKKKTNIELLKAKEIAEEASLLKTQFISTISHELRTPLYGVVGITNMLLEEHKELARSPHLSSLKFSARYLLSLVNDILQINKIEENKVVLENLTFNILDEISMIKNSLSFLSQKNNNTIAVNIDPNIPEYLIGDKLRLAQIMINLVSNALKFTKNGEVIITANLIKVEGIYYFIKFTIKDNGIGIAIEDQSKIFEKFVQVGRKEEDYQGTGLGLTIVKRLLGLFGSSIEIESDIGKGTMFTFTIAFEYNLEKTKKLINEIQVDLTSNQEYKVLVVEDNRINQIVTKRIIENNNYSCKVVDDGFAALEILEIEDFDIILMDINMPLMNGFETTKRIRLKNIKTPIVALTAFDKDEINDEAVASGINEIIIKPFEPVKLFKIINYLIVETKNVGY